MHHGTPAHTECARELKRGKEPGSSMRRRGKEGNPLHIVSTENAGGALKKAVELNDNEKLCVKLNTGINPEDAHAIDIEYHKR